MSKKETHRAEAERRGTNKTAIYRERNKQGIIDAVGGDFPIVYVWRWSNDDTYAKIGHSESITGLEFRINPAKTYHPTDDPILIGFMRGRSVESVKELEKYFLDELERTRPDREWVIIDEEFNEIIDEAFISDPDELDKIFGGRIKTTKIV